MSDHELKIWPQYMHAKMDGIKPWEHRSTADRTFKVGDTVTFREFYPGAEIYTGVRYGPCTITYVHELPGNFCIFTHTEREP